MVSSYLLSNQKRIIDISIAGLLLIVVVPVFILISLMVLVFNGWPIFFIQKRIGKGGTAFRLIKFRTMYKNASKDQTKYRPLNEADGPVFKIRNDPRFVGIGQWLSKTGLDELPQLFNVLRGEMSVVGPRPLPLREHAKISNTYSWRADIKPGILSSWVVGGWHSLSFSEWMELDKSYQEEAVLITDISIIVSLLRQELRIIEEKFILSFSYLVLVLIAYILITYK